MILSHLFGESTKSDEKGNEPHEVQVNGVQGIESFYAFTEVFYTLISDFLASMR